MKFIIVSLFMLLCTVVHAEEWINISKADTVTFDILVGSIKLAKTESGVNMIVGTGRIIDMQNRTTVPELWYVPLANCQMKRGVIVSLNMNGKFKTQNEFVFGLGTVASEIAEVLCLVAFDISTNTKQSPKSTV